MYFPKEGSLICYIKLIQFNVIPKNRKTNRKERKSKKIKIRKDETNSENTKKTWLSF